MGRRVIPRYFFFLSPTCHNTKRTCCLQIDFCCSSFVISILICCCATHSSHSKHYIGSPLISCLILIAQQLLLVTCQDIVLELGKQDCFQGRRRFRFASRASYKAPGVMESKKTVTMADLALRVVSFKSPGYTMIQQPPTKPLPAIRTYPAFLSSLILPTH